MSAERTKEEIHYEIVSKHLDFKGKRILEIGCGAGDLTRYMGQISGAEFINGIEYDLSYWSVGESSGSNWKITEGDVRALNFDDCTFDYIISVGVFEHINDLEKGLKEMERVLKPGGQCFAWFEPIYTSIIGHHYNFWIPEDLYLIPPWGHLFMTQDEMYNHIKSVRDDEIALKAVEWIYNGPVINRYTRKDYYRFLSSSGMTTVYLREMYQTNREGLPENEFYSLSENQQRTLLAKHAKDELSVRGFEVVLEKNMFWHKKKTA